MSQKKNIWKEFERHYLIERDSNEWLFGNVNLLEEGKIGNYSSFPYAKEIWNDLCLYVNRYVKEYKPKHSDTYGDYYVIKIPSDFTEYRFWDNLDFNLMLILNGTYKQRTSLRNGYWYVEDGDEQAIEYIKDNGKFETLKIDLGEYVEAGNLMSNGLKTNFFHEFLHAYEDLQRIVKGNKGIDNYNTSTNYDDYFTKRVGRDNLNYREINRLCTLFHFFNKTEIRALISQLSGEIQTRNDINQLNAEQIITSTESWKEIEDAEYSVELISNCADISGQTELINKFNEHSKRKKVKNFDELVRFLQYKMFNIKQYIFKKISKIIGDIERNNLEHSI